MLYAKNPQVLYADVLKNRELLYVVLKQKRPILRGEPVLKVL